MCHRVAKYFLCGHRHSVNVMYCPHAQYSGTVCHKPPLKPIPSSPVHASCPDCLQRLAAPSTAAANIAAQRAPLPLR